MTHPADIAFNDQTDAATAHTARIINHAAPTLFGDQGTETETEPWLIERIEAFAAGILAGTVSLCPHLEHTAAPRPGVALLTAARAVCTRCTGSLLPTGGTLPCDRCGTPTDLMEPALAQLGPLALLIIQCDPCASLRDETP